MSLLDDVSIVVTPNGYKAGTLFGAIPVPTEGSNVVVNGDFTTDSDWTKGTGWTISGGTANCDGTQTGTTSLTPALNNVVNNVTYIVEYTISNYTSGSISIKLGNTGYGVVRSANGTYTEEIKALATTFPRSQINADASFIGSIDNVSVKEYTSADMDVTRATAATRVDENGLVNYAEVLGDSALTGNNSNFDTGIGSWVTYIGGSLAHDTDKLEVTLLATGSGTRINTNSLISGGQVGKTFKVRAKIWQGTTTATSLNIYLGSVQKVITISSTPTYFEVELTPTSTAYLTIYRGSSSGGTFFIDDVTVKEVTRDNVPRIDYTGGGCPHILAEPQRTNLIPYSEAFGSWHTLNNVTITQDTTETTSPSGTNNASKILVSSASTPRRLFEVISTSSGSDYTFTLYAKKGTTDFIRVYFSSSIIDISFDLTNGTKTVTAGTGSIESVGNDWYRIQGTGTSSLTTEVPQIQLSNSASVNDYLYIWGSQLEEGSYATSYIPTSGSTVTRNQDQFTRDGIGSLINSTEGVLFTEIASLSESGNYRELGLSDGTTSNRVLISYKSTDNVIRGSFQGSGGANLEYTVTSSKDFHKIAVKWKVNDFSLWVDGVEVGSDTSGSSFPANTLNSINFNSGSGGDIFYGKVKQLQVYKTALTDTQLAALTS